ncbi:hypothetical protein ACA910_020424 [Epithemia clementina (nom. ined.)]
MSQSISSATPSVPSSHIRRNSGPGTPSTNSLGSVAISVSSASSTTSQQRHPHNFLPEDRLTKTWKTLANCFIAGSQKAEKVARIAQPPYSNSRQSVDTMVGSPQQQQQASLKELDDYVSLFLRTRLDWGRLVTYLEAKLEGTAQEMETIQHYYRTMPVVSKRGGGPGAVASAVVDGAGSPSDAHGSRKRKEAPSSSVGDFDNNVSSPKAARSMP